MIQFSEVTKRYPNGQVALDHVSFAVNSGEMAFLTGHSGAGKSTLLKLMWAEEQCTQGAVTVNGYELASLLRSQIPQLRRSMGIVLQSPDLLQERTIFDNVALPLVVAGFSQREMKRRVHAALAKVGLAHKERQLPHMLSLGEQQRVGIARAVVNKPQLLLADEPTGNLDPELSADIMRLFTEFNRVGVTVLIATHDLGLIATLPYRVLILQKGTLLGGRKA